MPSVHCALRNSQSTTIPSSTIFTNKSKKGNQLVAARWLSKNEMINNQKATFNVTCILSFSRFGELLSKRNTNTIGFMAVKGVDSSKLFKL